ncbi:bromodomain-containing protein 8-like isoform X2 [Scleropages formosus]|uniref:bromodomain-containing protein 8-like isoform X2 n=1 Tax=Scleropages formosus TaxID=113540 RepID=UPI0010FAAF47|nr:bromodomain-containing protein 8-like isoform X2 [Scleropages formosus]
MASGVGKHKLLSLGPTEPWSVREKLCLASSVMKSGDQNWVSVSRAIKPFAEPGRPPDWFSQKHCASQYSELLETTETPKRKRGEKGEVVETVEDVIVRKLTAERIEELKRLIKDTQEKHRKLKRESELIQAGHLDSKLEELWGSIVQKKKQEEEEAELKRKTTDAAYQARLAVKNTPKRAPSVTVRSPLGASSPSLDFSLIETTQPIPEDPSTTATAPGAPVFMPLPETPGPGSSEAGLGSLLDDSPQKKILGQKATPPPSPLLSELLKKGSLLPTSPRLVGEGDVTAGHMTGPHGTELQVSVPTIPASQAATGAPTLSRLLEAGPTQFPSPLGSLATTETPAAVVPPTLDTSASLSTGADMAESTVPRACTLPGDGKAGELADEDLVTVSYMGDELDLETVGDIIAIIEEKVDDNAEALDAAAVEAALSLCEEVADGHTLPNPWEPGPFKPPDPNPVASTVSACPAVDPSLELKKELLEDKVIVGSPASFTLASGPQGSNIPHPHLSPVPPSCTAINLESDPPSGAGGVEGLRDGSPTSPNTIIKFENEEWTQPGGETPGADSLTEDNSASGKHPKDIKEEDPGSDGEEGSISELKECGEGDVGEECTADGEGPEAYLSEAELEPAASESEDGYSLHTASSLQLHNTADSIPSSPASSQFSMCSEDQEAIQAQKIWKKAIMLVWRAAANHRYANVFLQPVTDDIAPGYHSIVHRPMDLSTIKKNIETGLIRTTAEFQRDIMLMFQNAVMYNSSDHDVYHMALEMQRDVLEQIQQFLATQLIMQTSESGISAKSLRGRDSTRKQDSSDKDSVPMASPAFLLSLFVSIQCAAHSVHGTYTLPLSLSFSLSPCLTHVYSVQCQYRFSEMETFPICFSCIFSTRLSGGTKLHRNRT